jgi:hypothetical protein
MTACPRDISIEDGSDISIGDLQLSGPHNPFYGKSAAFRRPDALITRSGSARVAALSFSSWLRPALYRGFRHF